MPFDYPDDMTMGSYEMYAPARPHQTYDPLRQGGELPPPGHSHDEEDDSLANKIDNQVSI